MVEVVLKLIIKEQLSNPYVYESVNFVEMYNNSTDANMAEYTYTHVFLNKLLHFWKCLPSENQWMVRGRVECPVTC